MLVCRNLSVERDGRLLFQPFSIQVAAGQVLTLEGPSGLGKSTLLGALVGPLPGISLSGDIHLHGLTWSSVPVQAGRAQMVFQEPSLFPHLSIGANVALGLEGLSRDAKSRRVTELFRMLGLNYRLDHPASALSRGEAMRVQIARALAPEPQVLLLDEAFSALDPSRRCAVRDLVFQWVEQTESICIQVTHAGEDRPIGGVHQCLMPVSAAG